MRPQIYSYVCNLPAILIFVGNLIAATLSAQVSTLSYDNGPFINRPGSGPGGADGSAIQDGMGIFGWSAAQSHGTRVADDFAIPTGETWTLSMVRFFGYCPLAATDSGFSGLTLQIWAGQPGVADSHVLWGGTTANILTGSAFMDAYCYQDGSPDTVRPIFWADGSVNITLGAGTYWLDWAFLGPVGAYGPPFQMPINIDGETTTGNALSMLYIGSWSAATDVGPQGFPFQVFTVVPEPSTASLALALGLAFFGARGVRMPSKQGLTNRIAANPAMTRRLHIGCDWRGVADPGR